MLVVVARASTGGDAHAGHTETSLLLALRPDLVRGDRAVAGETAPLRELIARLRADGVQRRQPNGVLGDPTGADARVGRAHARRTSPTTSWPPSTAGSRRHGDHLHARPLDPPARRAATSSSAARRCGLPADAGRDRGRSTASPPATTSRPVDRSRPARRSPARRRRHPPPPDRVAVHGGRRHRRRAGARARRDGADRVRPRLPRRRRGRSPSTTPPTRRSRAVDGARVLRLRTNAGPAVARNAGLGRGVHAAGRVRRHRRPAGAGLARPAARPLRRRARRARRARVWPARPAPVRWPPTSRATPRSTSAPSRGASPPARRLSYVPAAALVVRTEALRAIGGLRPSPALRRGRRRRLASGRGRMAVPLRAGGRRPPPAARHVARPRRPARRLRLVGCAARPQRTPARWRPVRISGWSAGRGASLAAGPSAGRGRARRRAPPPRSCASCPASRRRSRCGWPGSATSTPAACSPTPRRRTWWPVLAAGSLVSPRVRRRRRPQRVPALLAGGIPRLVDDLAYGVGVWKGVLATRDPAPLVPSCPAFPARRST